MQPRNVPVSDEREAQPDASTIDRAIDRIIAREHYEAAVLGYFHPIVETHIEDMKFHGVEQVPWRSWDLRGRANVSTNLAVRSISAKNQDSGYEPAGFLQEAFIDRDGFDRQHYSFRYVGREDVAGVHCLVFDVEPLTAATGGRFRGRIWAEDRGYTIIRFSGAFMPLHRWEFLPAPHLESPVFAEFDSWRSSIQPDLWLPSYITSQKSDMREVNQRWAFNAQTRFSDYAVANIHALSIPPYEQAKFQNVVPAHPRLGKSFWVPWAANFALMVTANELTAACLHPNGCIEGDLLLGKRPTRVETYAVRGSLTGLLFYMARKSKLKGDGFGWKFPTYAILALYGLDAAHDAYGTAEHSGPHPALIAKRSLWKSR